MSAKPETALQHKIRKHLEERWQAVVFKHHGSVYSEKGISDLICAIPIEWTTRPTYNAKVASEMFGPEGAVQDYDLFKARIKATHGSAGIFAAFEVKMPGKNPLEKTREKWTISEVAQVRYIEKILQVKGIAGFVSSTEDVDKLILAKLKQVHVL